MTKIKKSGEIKGTAKILKNLKNVINAVGHNYSIRVGIIGEKGGEIHPETNLTNAQLGAVHEFGAEITINHPGGQPYIFLENGQARFVKKDSKAGQEAIKAGRVTKPHTYTVNIPARSFLRNTLFDKAAQERIYAAAALTGDKDVDKELVLLHLMQGQENVLDAIAEGVGAQAVDEVKTAFYVGGFPDKWKPITQFTKDHRKGDPDNPPLNDTGELMESITFDYKKVK